MEQLNLGIELTALERAGDIALIDGAADWEQWRQVATHIQKVAADRWAVRVRPGTLIRTTTSSKGSRSPINQARADRWTPVR